FGQLVRQDFRQRLRQGGVGRPGLARLNGDDDFGLGRRQFLRGRQEIHGGGGGFLDGWFRESRVGWGEGGRQRVGERGRRRLRRVGRGGLRGGRLRRKEQRRRPRFLPVRFRRCGGLGRSKGFRGFGGRQGDVGDGRLRPREFGRGERLLLE